MSENKINIYISATTINAAQIFRAVLSCLRPYFQKNELSVHFAKNNSELAKINSGEIGYHNIGKFMTIITPSHLLEQILETLHKATLAYNSICVREAQRYKNSRIVFFEKSQLASKIVVQSARYSQIPSKYQPVSCLSARGKTRIFRALNADSAETVILKEGIMLGEPDKFGNDGMSLVMNEEKILKCISSFDYFPKLIESFYVNDSYFIVEEFFSGVTLMQLMLENPEKLSPLFIRSVLNQLINIFKSLHSNRIRIGDLSPANIIISKTQKDSRNPEIKIIDLEFYSKYDDDYIIPPATAGFSSEKYIGKFAGIYSLLSIWHYLEKPLLYKNPKNPIIIQDDRLKLLENSDYEDYADYEEILVQLEEKVNKPQIPTKNHLFQKSNPFL